MGKNQLIDKTEEVVKEGEIKPEISVKKVAIIRDEKGYNKEIKLTRRSPEMLTDPIFLNYVLDIRKILEQHMKSHSL